jgi:hypothetical protein
MSDRRRRSASARAGFVLLPVALLLALVSAVAFQGIRGTGLASATARGATTQDKARYAAEAGLNRAILEMHADGCGGWYPAFLFSPVWDGAFDGASYYAYASPLAGSPVTLTSTGTFGDASITLIRSNTPMHQSTATTLLLQPGASGIDTYVQNGGSSGNGTQPDLKCEPGNKHALLRFDLTSIPAGSHVTSATLSSYATSGSGSDAVALHRLTRDWTEAATWSSSDGGTAWNAAGGDIHATAVATANFSAPSSWLSWDLTALVDKWVKGSLPNQGVQARVGVAVSGLTLASSDATTATQRPKLSVTFLPPCGWTPPAPTTVTLAPSADTDIDSSKPTSNFGSATQIWVSSQRIARTLARFDLTGIPAGRQVLSAKLRLYLAAMTPDEATKNLALEVHAMTQSWTETGATWINAAAGTPWTPSPGGSYRSSADAALVLPKEAEDGQSLEFELAALAQEWVDAPSANAGLIVINTTSASDLLKFSSKEASSNRPQLVVTYQ